VTIELIDNVDRFEAIRAEWNELLASSASESPFLTWEWLYSWWIHLAAGRRLAIVAVRDAKGLIAIAPLCASRGRMPLMWRYELMGSGSAGSDYLDAIVRRGYEMKALDGLADFVQWKDIAIQLVRLPQHSALAKLAFPLAGNGWSVRAAGDGYCPFIRLSGHSWDSFLSTISPAHRATTRRRLRLLDRNFTTRFAPVTDDAMRQEALARLFEFHRVRFGEKGTAFNTATLCNFHRDATKRLRNAGILRLFTLHLNDDLAGVMYGMSFKNRFFFFQHGYDARFQAHGIGRAVLDLSIRSAIEEGLAEFDLLYGGEAYKSAWTDERRPLERLELFPADFRGRTHRRVVETERALRTFARHVISTYVPQTN
jgi:CelD/BcsL family acetyltransferase involved in cellulose biosynthesis